MKKNKRKKYGVGGNVRHYIESPSEAMTEYDISLARAQEKANSNGWAQGLSIFGNMAMQYGMSQAGGLGGVIKGAGQGLGITKGQEAATGGKIKGQVPVEVEGDEIAETPMGEILEFDGATHEEGGIDTILPSGTDIFSARVKGPDGKTMAERKKARERKENKISKLFEKTPTDKLLQKTLEKTKANNMITEKKDMQKQEMVKTIMALGSQVSSAREKFKDGGTVFGNLLRSIFGSGGEEDLYDENGLLKWENVNLGSGDASLSGANKTTFNNTSNTTSKESQESMLNFNMTGGDLLGLWGQYKAGTDPMKNTLKNRAGDTPNINAFKDYGNDALDVNEESQGYIAGQRANALKDIERASVGAKNRNRNSARGVNAMRALDLGVDMAGNQSREGIYDSFAKQMMQILTQKSQLENLQDEKVMQGEKERDMNDRMDRDNFYSQMAQDLATKNLMTQHMGKNFNSIQEREVTQNLINQLSQHGLTIDKNGNIVGMTE